MFTLLMACGACHATPPSKRPADKGNAVAALTPGTIVDDIDVHDTVEDPAYVVAGEQLAQDVAVRQKMSQPRKYNLCRRKTLNPADAH